MDILPNELLYYIGKYLNCRDLVYYSLVNRVIHEAINNLIMYHNNKYHKLLDRYTFAERLIKHAGNVSRGCITSVSLIRTATLDIFGDFSFTKSLKDNFSHIQQEVMAYIATSCENGTLIDIYLQFFNKPNIVNIKIRDLFWKVGRLWSVQDVYHRNGSITIRVLPIFRMELDIILKPEHNVVRFRAKSVIFREALRDKYILSTIPKIETIRYIRYIFNQNPKHVYMSKKVEILDATVENIKQNPWMSDIPISKIEEIFRPLV